MLQQVKKISALPVLHWHTAVALSIHHCQCAELIPPALTYLLKYIYLIILCAIFLKTERRSIGLILNTSWLRLTLKPDSQAMFDYLSGLNSQLRRLFLKIIFICSIRLTCLGKDECVLHHQTYQE